MFADLFSNSNNVHYVNIWIIGILFQGIYQYSTTGKLRIEYFILYVVLTYICSLLYYNIFSESV